MTTFWRRTFVVLALVVTFGLPVMVGFANQGQEGGVEFGVYAGVATVALFWAAIFVVYRVGGWLVRVWRGS